MAGPVINEPSDSSRLALSSGYGPASPREPVGSRRVFASVQPREMTMGRALGLWLLGVPVFVIVLIALFTNFI